MAGSLFKRLWRRALQLAALVLLAPVLAILVLRWVDPPTSSVIVQARVDALLNGHDWSYVRQQWTSLDTMAPSLQLAAIAAEDQRFAEHWGFDLDAIADALESRARGGRLRGASTITQQVAKNLFLSHSRNWLRKSAEAYLTGWIELLWPKRRTLEVYLNIAQFSARDYGVLAASRSLFGVTPATITEHQAALLAAALPDPDDRRPDRPSAYLSSRAQWIQRQMHQLGYAYLQQL